MAFRRCGRPAAVLGLNHDGLRRAKLADATIEALERAHKLLFASEFDVPLALDRIAADATTEEERHLVSFVQQSRQRDPKRGLCQAPRRHHQPGLGAEFDDRLAAEEAETLLGATQARGT
jgi:hypothetical protein